jgi:protein-tyrosine-phosphatase/DNA-binding transcriptional ArsR family regulator
VPRVNEGSVAIWRPPSQPPPFLRLLGHPVRWRLVRELVHSDRAVSELRELVDEPQSLVSYHLRLLREGGLVSRRQSSADRRDSDYAIDLSACQTFLSAAGDSLHPGIALQPVARPARGVHGGWGRRPRVLFLCTGNSARSQIAEALLARMSDGTVDVVSAGSHPKALHPNAVRALKRRGIDISRKHTKHLDLFVSEHFDFVITLCDRVREVCPELPSHPSLIHWSIPDPALEGPSDRASYPAFERTVTELETRIRFFIALIDGSSPRRTTAHANR